MSDIEFDYDDDTESFDLESDEESINAPLSPGDSLLHQNHDDGPLQYKENGTYYRPWLLVDYAKRHVDRFHKLGESHLGCSDDDLLILLHHCNWRPDEVVNAFFEDKVKLYKDAGIPMGPHHTNFKVETDFFCNICCEHYIDPVKTYSLLCQHTFCISCWYQYAHDAVVRGSLIACMIPDCTLSIPHRDLDEMWDSQDKSELSFKIQKQLQDNPLIRSSARVIIDAQTKYKWCPATDCTNFTELLKYTKPNNNEEDDLEYALRQGMEKNKSIDLSRVPVVKCFSGHEFCFNCNYENHLPCPCWVVKNWVKKCEDDSETANWIEANTHSCPKCESLIEKNGGCNHMTCKKCRYEFCWICLHDWSEHNNQYYTCNRYKEESVDLESKKAKSRQSLNRYIHFYKRFTIHESSMKLDNKVLQQITDIAVNFLEVRRGNVNGNDMTTWSDVQFLPDTMKALQNGRKTLKWTYTFAFYLKDSNFQEIFELNQSYLNKTVEDLSELFEKIITASKALKGDASKFILENKSKIMDLAKLVSSRQKNLIEGTGDNLRQGLLSFDR